jgi:hypothetical protein
LLSGAVEERTTGEGLVRARGASRSPESLGAKLRMDCIALRHTAHQRSTLSSVTTPGCESPGEDGSHYRWPLRQREGRSPGCPARGAFAERPARAGSALSGPGWRARGAAPRPPGGILSVAQKKQSISQVESPWPRQEPQFLVAGLFPGGCGASRGEDLGLRGWGGGQSAADAEWPRCSVSGFQAPLECIPSPSRGNAFHWNDETMKRGDCAGSLVRSRLAWLTPPGPFPPTGPTSLQPCSSQPHPVLFLRDAQ